MEILDRTKTVYLGKATESEGSKPVDPNSYGFYIDNNGNLIMVYREYKPEYEIIDGYLYTSEEGVFINADGYLMKEVL